MKIGDKVRIVKCVACPKVVGKIAEIIEITATIEGTSTDTERIRVKFGKGRPQLNRPSVFACDDVVLVEEIDDEDNCSGS